MMSLLNPRSDLDEREPKAACANERGERLVHLCRVGPVLGDKDVDHPGDLEAHQPGVGGGLAGGGQVRKEGVGNASQANEGK